MAIQLIKMSDVRCKHCSFDSRRNGLGTCEGCPREDSMEMYLMLAKSWHRAMTTSTKESERKFAEAVRNKFLRYAGHPL